MKKISYWASGHIWSTRFIIIGIYVVLNLLGLFLGDLLSFMEINIPAIFLYCNCVFCLFGVLFYPARNKKSEYKNFYRRHKSADLILITSTFIFIVYAGNHLSDSSPTHTSTLYATVIETASGKNHEIKISSSIKENGSGVIKKLPKKELRKKLKEKLKELRKLYKESSDGEKIALIILSVLIAAGLLYLLAILACTISCSGSEALAIAVALLGTGLIIFLLVRVIRRITRGPRKKKE